MNHQTVFDSAVEMGRTIIAQQRAIDALVAALERLLDWEEDIHMPGARADFDQALAALALARGGK